MTIVSATGLGQQISDEAMAFFKNLKSETLLTCFKKAIASAQTQPEMTRVKEAHEQCTR
jgi:hypothetical protein